ncbi:MAG: DUF1569 domain-containing protein [Cytophagaceae bacterium]
MIEINNREDIKKRFSALSPDMKPLFGKMTAQHMVEHLSFTLMISNGKFPQKLHLPVEKAKLMKDALLKMDTDIPRGFKAPLLGEDLPKLAFADLSTAIGKLFSELERFDAYFTENASARPTHPVLGDLNHQEWTSFHNKHFKHHFLQFGLV